MKNILKIVFTFCFIFSVSANLFAQNSLLRKANKLYEIKAYSDAIPKYKQVLKKDSTIAEALINLADCYRLTNNVNNALRYYAKVVHLSIAKPIHQYYYAQALMQTGDYTAAEKYMSEYGEDDRGKTFSEAIIKLSEFYKDTAYYKVKIVSFNAPQNDFSPVLLDEKVIFVSARTRAQVISYMHSWTDRNYYFLYQTEIGKKEKFTKPKLFARNIQIRFNDGPVCFGKDKTIYFTRNNLQNNKAVKAMNGDVKLNLYQAVFNEKKKRFDNIQAFAFNSNEYNTAHPAISTDGTKLYFSSDMPGGYGGMDIWVSYKVGTAWSIPENLGNKVNSAGNEIFPYISDNGTLYFSSNGLEGIGGLDIFYIKLNDKGLPTGNPKNIGAPINSMADDFGITFYPNEKKGFFSSNRTNFDLNDDIFEFTVNKPEKQPYIILVMDSITREILDAGITITDNETGEETELTKKEEKYTAELYPGHTFTIAANSKGYISKSNISYTAPEDNSKVFEILLNPNPRYFISGTVYEIIGDQTTTVENAQIVITDNNDNVVYSYITDASGKYLSPDLLPNTKYTVTASLKGYFTKSEIVPFIPPGGVIKDFYLTKIVIGKAIKIENIYFDYDKSNIRPDAAVELDKIVKLLNENPEIIIELGSHTDCRGSASYNASLSDRRAKSSAAYIVSMGIDKKRISGKGYGESQLINGCKCEGALKSTCSEEEHQLNRRTEFKVTGFVKGIGNVNLNSAKNKSTQ